MKEHWDKLIGQLEEADKACATFLEEGMLSSMSLQKARPFLKQFNAFKKMMVSFDAFIAPVEPLELTYSFESPELSEMWIRWKDYLAEQHGMIMRTRAEKSAMEHLNDISKGDENQAVRFLRYAMANQYRSFFAINEKEASQPVKEDKGVGSAFG